MRRRSKYLSAVLITMALPFISLAQDPGGNPDGNPPPVVPFSDNMNIILIVVGISFSVIVLNRFKKRPAKN